VRSSIDGVADQVANRQVPREQKEQRVADDLFLSERLAASLRRGQGAEEIVSRVGAPLSEQATGVVHQSKAAGDDPP
jgi:hypothetical protein